MSRGSTRSDASRRLVTPVGGLLLCVAVALISGPVAALTLEDLGLPSIAIAHAIAFVAATLVDRPGGWGPSSAGPMLGGVALALLVGDVLVGVPTTEALRGAVGSVACGVTAAAVIAARRKRSWFPGLPADVGVLVLAAVVAAPVGLVLGAFPGARVPGDPALLVWAAVRGYVVLVVTMASVLPLVHGPEQVYSRPRFARFLPLSLLGTAACLVVPYVRPDLHISWVALLPAMWAGMTMTPRAAATLTLVIAIVAGFTPYADAGPAAASWFLPQISVDLLVSFICLVALQIVVLRETEGRIAADLDADVRRQTGRREFLDGVLDSMRDGLLLVRPDGTVIRSNEAAARLVDGKVPTHITAGWAEAIDLQQRDVGRILDAVSIDRSVAPEENPRRTELTVHPDAPEARSLRVTSRGLAHEDEQLVLMFVTDTTAEESRAKELASFAGTVAHDLKGPLSGLQGWILVAADELGDDDPRSAAAALDRATGSAERMGRLIDDMLAYTVAHEGELRSEPVVVADVAGDLAHIYSGGGERAATFVISATHAVQADPVLTRQLMANLIGNSIKYARPDAPPFVEVCTYDGEPGWVEVEVSDKGRGLQPGDEERIFAAFDRSDKDATSVQGIGLGLSLCAAIVARHGGRIGAENNEWGGATFVFTLPAAS